MKPKKKAARRAPPKVEIHLTHELRTRLTSIAKQVEAAMVNSLRGSMADRLYRRTRRAKEMPLEPASRFTKLDAEDNPLPVSAKDWKWVHDARTGLTWPAEIIEGSFGFDAAGTAAKEFAADCRAPEVWEVLSVIDYTRSEPAVDTTFFRWKAKWIWTATKYAGSPLGGAWLVSLHLGGSDVVPQDLRGCALAVRVSQSPRASVK